MLTTTVSVTVKLTPSETKLLRFFADQCPPSRQGKRMYESLNTQGLIHRPGQRDRYEITELGRQTIATLDQDTTLPASHQLGQPAPPPGT
jgi:predicted transcriptional regulator